MSSTYTTYLGTVSFTATAESWAEPAGSDIEVIGFPGGDSVAISISGQRETRRIFKALCASVADFKLLRQMRAKAGTLLVENWDSVAVNAVLVRVSPDPVLTDGRVVIQAEFILY